MAAIRLPLQLTLAFVWKKFMDNLPVLLPSPPSQPSVEILGLPFRLRDPENSVAAAEEKGGRESTSECSLVWFMWHKGKGEAHGWLLLLQPMAMEAAAERCQKSG